MAEYFFGEIKGIKEGTNFVDRKELRNAGVHLALVAGIDGNSKSGSPSIVLNGGYVDDYDLGNEIVYTGHGGNDPNSKKQINDQSWDAAGNKALIISEMHGLPVRVTRGFKHKSSYSPKIGYRYAGLYSVTDHFEDKGKDGFMICRFRLQKLDDLVVEQHDIKNALPSGSEETSRISSTILRIVRDTKLSTEIKNLYDYTCQICGFVIAVRNVKYAEAAHIQPLGKPHNGKDQPGNILCLCPNHHVMLDKGIFGINNDFTLNGIDGKLSVHEYHVIDTEFLEYHNEHIFINNVK